MNAVDLKYNHLPQKISPSIARLVFSISSLSILSVGAFIVIYRYIIHRRRSKNLDMIKAHPKKDQDSWLNSALMEKGDPSFLGSHPASACDILRPLSQTSSCPSSGALAAMALQNQNPVSKSPLDGALSSDLVPAKGGSLQQINGTVQHMCDQDLEGVRTWKRVIVNYR